MPRQRRDRETAKEEQEPAKQQVGRTPQNQAKAKAGTRRAKSANNKDSVVAVVENNNNPLNKVVFINRVLRFVKQGYLESDSDSDSDSDIDSDIESDIEDDDESSSDVKKVIPIPKFIEFRHVSTSWKETVEFYNPRPQKNALTFCRHFYKLGSSKKVKVPSVQGSIALRDIVGWLSNAEITNISDDVLVSDEGDDGDFYCDSFLRRILWYFRSCLDSSAWKEEQPGFEHHAAFVRDTLLWISKYCVFDQNFTIDEDDVGNWCDIVDDIITRKKGEYFGFDTPEGRDVLLSVSKTINASACWGRYEAVTKWFDLVFTLTRDNEKAQKIFGTKEVLDEFIRLSQHEELKLFDDIYGRCDNPQQVMKKYYSSMFKSLSAITKLKTNVNLFATVELRDTMVRIFKWADIECYHCPDAKNFSRLLHNLIFTNKSNKKLFAVESVRDVMFRECEEDEYFAERDRNYDRVFDFRHRRWTDNIIGNEGACLFFENLLALVEVNPNLFLIDATRKCFVEFARRLVENDFCFDGDEDVSSATVRSYLTALQTMLLHNEKLFFSERIDDFLKKLKTEKKLLRGSTKLFSEIEKKYAKMKLVISKEEQQKKHDDKDENDDDEDEDLENDYWKKEEEAFVYSNCYYREREEEKRSNLEESWRKYKNCCCGMCSVGRR